MRLDVAQGHRHTVRSIGRPGRGLQAQQLLHHELHLLLGRLAGAAYRVLDLGGAVLGDGDVAQRSGEEDHAAGVAERDGRADVSGVEHAFAGDARGSVARDDLEDAFVHGAQARAELERIVGAHDAALHERHGAAALADDDAVTGYRRTGIDAENDQALTSSSAFSSMSALLCTFCTSSRSSSASSSLSSLCASSPATLTVAFGTKASSASSMSMPAFFSPCCTAWNDTTSVVTR